MKAILTQKQAESFLEYLYSQKNEFDSKGREDLGIALLEEIIKNTKVSKELNDKFKDVTLNGDIKLLQGVPGKTPEEKEIIKLIKPLIPAPKEVKFDKKELISLIKKLIPEPKVIDVKKDTPREIKRKLKKVGINIDDVKGLREELSKDDGSKIESEERIDKIEKYLSKLKKLKIHNQSSGSGSGSSSTTFDALTDTDFNALSNGQVATYNDATGKWENTTPTSGTSDHGLLSGLGDDDHTQYHNDSRADTWLSGKDTDDLSEGSTNKYMTTTEKTKVGYISVTQAVDLDTIESDTNTNNAKVSNATHTGEVTGSGALTVDVTAISNKTSKTVTGAEELLINDGGTLKKTTAQEIADLGGGSGDEIVLAVRSGSPQHVTGNNGVDTKITNYTQEKYDKDSAYSSGTFTSPTDGKYKIQITGNYNDQSGGSYYDNSVIIKKNGSNIQRTHLFDTQDTSTNTGFFDVEVIDIMSSGDTIEFFMNASSDDYYIYNSNNYHTGFLTITKFNN